MTARMFIAGALLLCSLAAVAQGLPPGEMPPADGPAEAIPPPAEPPPAAVSPETLSRLARDADALWRVALLAGGRFADRVALTQADLGRRLDRLARGQGGEPAPSPEAPPWLETLRAQPPEALPAVLAARVREDYPDLIVTLEGWAAGPEHVVVAALLPTLRAELEFARGMAPPALTGTGTSAPPMSSDGGESK